MSVALYPVFEIGVSEFDPSTAMSGKALARVVDGGSGSLEQLCRRLNVKPLFEFYSETKAEIFATAGLDGPENSSTDEGVVWSNPNDGLRTIEALLSSSELREMPTAVTDDLRALHAALLTAVNLSTRFRLRLDA